MKSIARYWLACTFTLALQACMAAENSPPESPPGPSDRTVVASVPPAPVDIVAINADTRGASNDAIASYRIMHLRKRNVVQPVWFGAVLGPGELQPDQGLVARSGSRALPTQFDIKAHHRDGSVRFGVVTLQIAANTSVEHVGLHAIAAESPPKPTSLEQLPGNFDAIVKIRENGEVFVASARHLLQASHDTTWLQGPLATEWQVTAPLRTRDGIDHTHLVAHFYIRAFANTEAVRVDVVVENTWTYSVTPRNITYDLNIDVDGKTVIAEQAVTHYRQARWRKTVWAGERPEFQVQPDVERLTRLGIVPRYDPGIRIPDKTLKKTWDHFNSTEKSTGHGRASTMGLGLLYPNMPAGGDRPDIGPFPRWAVQYLLTMDQRVEAAMLGTANQAGSFSIHYRDRKTGQPLSIQDYPQASLAQDGRTDILPKCTGDQCDVPYEADTAHQASLAFLPYLLTGDFYFLEEMMFWATFNNLFHNPLARGGDRGWFRWHQVRGQAWAMRNLGHLDWVLPDDHPMKAHYSRNLQENMRYYLQRYVGIDGRRPANTNTLGIVTEGPNFHRSRWYKTWMDDFFTWTSLHLVQLGYTEFQPMVDFKMSNAIARMINPDFCFVFAAIDTLNFRDSRSSPAYRDYGRIYSESVDEELRNTGCASGKMGKALELQKGEMLRWRRTPPRGYPLYMRIALAGAVENGSPGADEAWERFITRVNARDPSKSPEWALVPR